MVNIKGLDEFAEGLDGLTKALEALSGEIAQVKFDPNDPASIEAAIQEMETAIDQQIAPFRDNPMVSSIVGRIKEEYRQRIVDRAATFRSDGNTE